MKERSDQDDKRLTKEQRQREGHAMQSEKKPGNQRLRRCLGAPLKGREALVLIIR